MALILVVDDMPIFRELFEAVLRAEGYQTASASNGNEALAAMGALRPALVLLDLGMPVMDGVACLRIIRADETLKSTPVIVISSESDCARIMQVVRLGVSGYVLKTAFSLKALLGKIREALAGPSGGQARPARSASPSAGGVEESKDGSPTQPPLVAHSAGPGADADDATDVKSLKPIITRAELLDRLKTCDELKGFSPTVAQVLKLTASANSSLEAVCKAVRQDQAMALKILKLANSPAYTRGDRVDTVQLAISRIGMDSIRQAVLNIGVVERFNSAAFDQHLSTPQFWEHSIACGIIAAEIAHATDAEEADLAFTSGLLHDLGRVILAEALGDQYIRVIETARRIQAPLEAVESRMLLLNHADVMDRLLNAWKFSKHLVDPIMYHHLSAGNVRGVAPTRVPEILRLGLANRLAHAMMLGNSGNETIYPIEEHCRALKIAASTIRSIEETAREQTDDAKFTLVAHTRGGPWPRRSEQARDELRSPFRPMHVSADPEIDAYRIFCAQLADPAGDEPPNLAVVHITAARERDVVTKRLIESEARAGAENLPVLILSPAGQLALDDSTTAGRRCQIVSTPTPVARFIAVVNALLGADEARAAA